MSLSTGGIGGFGHNDKSPFVSDKLKLLKSNQKLRENDSSISPNKYGNFSDN